MTSRGRFMPSTPRSRPPRPYSARNDRSSIEPLTTSTSSSACGPAEELDAAVVLVAPEERHRRVRPRPARRVPRPAGCVAASGALLGGVRPVLDPHLLVEQLVRPARHVARRVHAGRPAFSVGVAHDAVAELEPAAGEPVGRPVRHRCRRRSRRPARCSPSPSRHPSRVDRRRRVMPQRIVDAVVGVDRPRIAAPISAPRPRINGAGAPSSTVTALPSRRAVAATSSPMKPAPITTTRAVAVAQVGARRSSASSSVRSSTTCGQSAWPGSRRGAAPVAMTSAVEGDLGPVGDASAGARSTSSPVGRGTEAPRHAERVEVVGLAQLDPVGLPFAGQQLLRQRRPVVRTVRLGTDDDQLAAVARRCAATRRRAARRASLRRRRFARASAWPSSDAPPRCPTVSSRQCRSVDSMTTDVTVDAVNAMVAAQFTGTPNRCAELGEGYAVARLRRRSDGAAPGRVHLRAGAVRPRRRRALVPRLRRDRTRSSRWR